MKIPLPFTICDLRFAIKKSLAGRAASRKSPIVNRKSQGIALVITLIMLSVTLIMAVAFIAVSRRERAAVSTGTDATTARLAADSALAAAEAQIVANIFSSTNVTAYDFKLLVSTNFINPYGFVAGVQNPTNVNYYYPNGNPITNAADLQQNIANLFFLPRAPVFAPSGGTNDFRFYLDLNRNRSFEDTSAAVPNVEVAGGVVTTNGTIAEIGDPQWVGILERPDQPHSAENHFIARYAFAAQPIGNSLDVNGLHNQALSQTVNSAPNGVVADGYFRNQGVGGWELNLAAFLADLNTNVWFTNATLNAQEYFYNAATYPALGWQNAGNAFDDARALLSYRYGFGYASLASANQVLANAAATLPFDNLDTYSDGPLQTTVTNIDESIPANRDNPVNSWVGADNPTNFFALPSELFDANRVSAGLVSRLTAVGANASTYDRYTFYRMLDQLGTDSAVDDARMNLNYDNVTPTNGVASATNLMNWTALTFFTNAADRLLKFHTAQWLTESTNAFYNYTNTFGTLTTGAFGVTAIPVYVEGRFVYTPAVNRLLQLAANLYDATTTNVYPSVFRPIFSRSGNNVFITGYTNIVSVSGPADFVFSSPTNVEAFAQVGGVNIPINLYGVPWILGAKKNLPAFNKFYSFNVTTVTRKLQVWRNNANLPGALETNQLYIMAITNRVGASFWNPYNAPLTNQTGLGYTVVLHDRINMTLTNALNVSGAPSATWPNAAPGSCDFQTSFAVWPGSVWGVTASDFSGRGPQAGSFVFTNFDYAFMPESIFYPTRNGFYQTALNPDPNFETGNPTVPEFPQFGLQTTNAMQAFILDGANIVDYVHFAGPNSLKNLSEDLRDKTSNPADNARILAGTAMWVTNFTDNAPDGVHNQVACSFPLPDGTITPGLPGGGWRNPGNMGNLNASKENQAAFFGGFYAANNAFYAYQDNVTVYYNHELTNQVPYTPTRYVYDYTFLQANDPLVHCLYADLVDPAFVNRSGREDDPLLLPRPQYALNQLGDTHALVTTRYQPWGRNEQLASKGGSINNSAFNLPLRDPLVWGADFWNFPTGKFPAAGWMGRVHRGTPWQTVFLKSGNVLLETNRLKKNVGTNTWLVWTGGNNSWYDLAHTAPVQDSLLFDLFTAAPNRNALRGALPVNQEHLASWSALFSGLAVLTNDLVFPNARTTPTVTNTIIDPAGVATANSAVKQIQNSILATRANTNLFPLGVFTHAGDILRAPALTEQSPFLNRSSDDQLNYNISDALYEWLPQQIMGLVKLGSPRYVVYCYGQSLKPAKDGTVLTGGAFSQLVTNYQVTAESAARVVLRVDNATGTNGAAPRVIIESVSPLEPQ